MPNTADEAILDDAVRIVNQAQEAGLTVRLLGAMAVKVQAGAHADLFYRLDRLGSAGKTFTDIDLVAYSRQRSNLHKFLENALRYRLDQYAVLMHGRDRTILHHPEGKYSIDVFFDKLSYSHEVHFGSNPDNGRLSLDPVTISPTDLVLEKIQIHEINEKDIKDLVTLFASCEISDQEGRGRINRKHIGQVLAGDWGFWYDANLNLDKIIHFAQKYREDGKLDSEYLNSVLTRISDLRKTIEEAPKTRQWKKREKDGTRKKWWNDVEERTR
ncbi:MAG: hypothetical protein ABSG74_05535 [Candidatus Bathyarchaeia archaeon]|jgi:hypothetical protein